LVSLFAFAVSPPAQTYLIPEHGFGTLQTTNTLSGSRIFQFSLR